MNLTALVAAQLIFGDKCERVRTGMEQDSAGAQLLLLGQSEGPRASYRRLNPLYQQPTEVEMIVKRV